MKVEQGQAGAGGGIGRALAVALASRGIHITVLDLKTTGEETVRLVAEKHEKISYKSSSPSAIFRQCDASWLPHLPATYTDSWRTVIEVNLITVIDGTSRAIRAMQDKGGLILNVGSAAGFIPVPFAPVYSASKGGVAMFTRSLAHLGMGIRVNVVCPEFVETLLTDAAPQFLTDYLRDQVGFVTIDRVLAAAFSLIDDESKTAGFQPTNPRKFGQMRKQGISTRPPRGMGRSSQH